MVILGSVLLASINTIYINIAILGWFSEMYVTFLFYIDMGSTSEI